MHITPIKTHKITQSDASIFRVIDQYVEKLEEHSILAVTSKIISICEGNIVKINPNTEKDDKHSLIEKEAELYLDPKENEYGFYLTITNNILMATAGIDESNGDGYFILWPKDPQESANSIRDYLQEKYKVKNVGVIITDSKTTILRWGTSGIGLSHSGFSALNDYVGKEDLFGRSLRVTQSNILDGLAAAAVVTMGEGNESTPLALITDIPNVEFQDRNPTQEEINHITIPLEKDLYAPLLKGAQWIKTKNS